MQDCFPPWGVLFPGHWGGNILGWPGLFWAQWSASPWLLASWIMPLKMVLLLIHQPLVHCPWHFLPYHGTRITITDDTQTSCFRGPLWPWNFPQAPPTPQPHLHPLKQWFHDMLAILWRAIDSASLHALETVSDCKASWLPLPAMVVHGWWLFTYGHVIPLCT